MFTYEDSRDLFAIPCEDIRLKSATAAEIDLE